MEAKSGLNNNLENDIEKKRESVSSYGPKETDFDSDYIFIFTKTHPSTPPILLFSPSPKWVYVIPILAMQFFNSYFYN